MKRALKLDLLSFISSSLMFFGLLFGAAYYAIIGTVPNICFGMVAVGIILFLRYRYCVFKTRAYKLPAYRWSNLDEAWLMLESIFSPTAFIAIRLPILLVIMASTTFLDNPPEFGIVLIQALDKFLLS